jgi:single-stranded-DNA-specific exonuclease
VIPQPASLRWLFAEVPPASDIAAVAALAELPPWMSTLLWQRGWRDDTAVQGFLQPLLKTLSDPLLLPGMAAGVSRIEQALDRGERITLYGDYDVDGVTSLALVTRVLRAYGCEPARFLPHRIDEGYGLSAEGVERCLERHRPQLLIALDCGTTSVAEIQRLGDAGVDVVVMDHHETQGLRPSCAALVNPKLGPAFHYLCSVGIAFKFAHALLKRRPCPGFDLRDVLDLVALGSVADLVPLVEENRILVRRGLAQLANSRWAGLRALIDISGLRPPFTPPAVGFGLGPRLNAAGRLGTAQDALELLISDDPVQARGLAHSLDRQNRDRRAVEDHVVQEAEKQLAQWFDPARHAGVVAGAPGWHPGVVGIAASRLQKRYHRPAVVIGFDSGGFGKGSGRSIEGLSLVDALRQCAEHLEQFGGHEMAAGLTLREDRLDAFREAFNKVARERLTDDDLRPRLHLDAEMPLKAVDLSLLDQLCGLEPFGIGNHAPTFFARSVTLTAEPRVMKEKHLSLLLRQDGREARAVWFGAAELELPRLPWDVAFTIERNEYQGRVTPQLHVRAVRSAL